MNGTGYRGYFEPSRREVLKLLAYGTAGLAVTGSIAGCRDDRSRGAATTGRTTASRRAAPSKALVVVELGGGNDSLSTLVPYTANEYRKARPTVALDEDELVDWGDGLGLNRRLQGINDRGLAILNGIGVPQPTGSHFAMLDRWSAGSTSELTPSEQAGGHPGFLGRLCDQVHGDERFTGLSIRFGVAPILRAAKAGTTSLPPTPTSFLAADPQNGDALARYLHDIGAGPADGSLGAARQSFGRVLWILDLLERLPEPSHGYPDTDFGTQLAVASRLLRAEQGIRVIHVPMGGSIYDTHARHRETHAELMTELNDGLVRFLDDLEDHGLADEVLVATISEFGRRVEEHSEGLDHGAASLAMLLGKPVNAGMHGDPSPLTKLDEDGNLVSTVTFDRYYATFASWLGIDPAVVLKPDDRGRVPTPIDGLLKT